MALRPISVSGKQLRLLNYTYLLFLNPHEIASKMEASDNCIERKSNFFAQNKRFDALGKRCGIFR